jgi:Fe2+ or Zn2+ uptake regulation protein
MSYYNTTALKGDDLSEAWTKSANQDELVLSIFVTNKEALFTPHEIQSILRDDYEKLYPITSVRRAINTLTEREALEKTSIRRKGPYGASNYCWKYKE